MCDVAGAACADDTDRGISRRRLLLGLAGTAAVASGLAHQGTAHASTTNPPIRRRAEWAGTLRPTGPLPVESAGNTRFLEVHHSVDPGNAYAQADVPRILREFYAFHTGKGWPDIAYNFLVDRFGTIWEGRAGSYDKPVIPSASGGHQGFSQKVCLIGDFRTQAPSPLVHDRVVSALARLAKKYGIKTEPGSTATFVSRGSSRLPRGTRCTLPTIVGHRKVAYTVCPGNAANHYVAYVYPTRVARTVAAG